MNFILGRVKNILGKGENAGYQHFLFVPKCFQKASPSRVVKSQDCVLKDQPIRRQIFRLVQIKTNCRQHFRVHSKLKNKCHNKLYGRKHCDKRRNCLLQAISPFFTMFSTTIYLQCIKMQHYVVMG